ncbi:hypothetical protein, partial [Enterobacter hormaechei]|uniref:hypothetical protein n=1 Tax=Enterobacter hormaechei TaxID=158836 RepID=UPI00195323E9
LSSPPPPSEPSKFGRICAAQYMHHFGNSAALLMLLAGLYPPDAGGRRLRDNGSAVAIAVGPTRDRSLCP